MDRQGISKDDAFHILQNARRRAVLRYLIDRETDQVDMRDVAEAVAAWESETSVDELGSDERQRVYIALYQSHLPKLADHAIIEYDQSRGVVRTTELTHLFDPFLEAGLWADADLTVEDEETGEDGGSEESGLRFALSTLFGR